MIRQISVILLALPAVGCSILPSDAAESDLVALKRVADLALTICLAGGSANEVQIVGTGDSLDVRGSRGTINIKKSEARGLIGGLSPNMTEVLAGQTSEARSCTVKQFSSLSEKLWAGAGSPTLENAGATPMIRYVDGDEVVTTLVGQISSGRDIVICSQNRDLFEEGTEVLTVRLVRAFRRQGDLVNQEINFQPSEDACRSENKSGHSMRAHIFDAGQYAVVTRTAAGYGYVALFEHYIGRPMRRLARALFGIRYVNIFTLEIRVQ